MDTKPLYLIVSLITLFSLSFLAAAPAHAAAGSEQEMLAKIQAQRGQRSVLIAQKLLHQVKLTKTYHQNHTFNLIYQSPTKPLTDKQIQPIRKKISTNLSRKHRAKLVGKID